MSYEQKKMEYEGKMLLAEETKEFLKDLKDIVIYFYSLKANLLYIV